MAVAVVDTGIFVGIADTEDRHHATASEIVRGMDHGDLPTGRVTNYVAHETLNWIHARLHHGKATETYERLDESAGFEIVQAARKDFGTALEYFEIHDGLSFGDATIAAYMQREGIEYLYSFDDDFDVIDGITRLESAENPFE